MQMKTVKEMKEVVKRILRDVERKHLAVVAAGLAYYFLMSLVPAMVVLTAVAAYLPTQNGQQVVTSFLSHIMPRQSIALIEQILTTIAPHRSGLLSFGIIATLWLTSKAIKGIISGLDIVYDVHVPRPLWINRIFAFLLTLAIGVLLLLGVVLSMVALVSETGPSPPLWIKVEPYVQRLLAAMLIFGAIELLYLLGPNVPTAQRLTIPGALFAAASWVALSWGLGFYFQHFGDLKLDRIYGVFATPIALLIWLNWSAIVILIGAEINVNLRPRKILTAPNAEESALRRTNAA